MKKDILQDVRAVRGMGHSLSYHHVVMCKVMLVEARIKRREVVVGARRIRSEKLGEHQYREGYAMSLEGNNVEQVKWVIVESAREMCGSVRVEGKNPKRVCSGMMR